MYCQKCGQENGDDAKFCVGCGNGLEGPFAYQHGGSSATAALASAPGTGSAGMSFTTAISTCLANFANFKGRASRSEYWWFYLFTVLLSWGATLVEPTQTLSALLNLVMSIPVFAAGARRLHDTGRSGWWQLLYLTIIGIIPVVIWQASKGSDQANEYGPPL